MNKFKPYMDFLKGVSDIVGREVKPSSLAVELYLTGATSAEAAADYGNEL